MNTKPIRSALLAMAVVGAGAACAQLSSPLGAAKPAAKVDGKSAAASPAAGAPAASAANVLGVPAGQGAGVHSPNSPFAPLVDRGDVIPWSVLTSVKTKTEKNKITPVFSMDQLALNQKSQRIQGFMMPLEPGEKQRHFLLTSVPMSCSFCVPGGPESMVEVRTKTPVKYTLEPVVVEGKFAVLNDDNYGLYYRITDAASVK
jgi:uncharacterized protein